MKFTRDAGDFKEYDLDSLHQELISELGHPEGKWGLSGHGTLAFSLYIFDVTLDISGVMAIVSNHGNDSSIILRASGKRKLEAESNMIVRIRESYDINEEYKILRLGIFDNTNTLVVTYNNFIIGLKTQLTTMKSNINIQAASNIDYTIAVPSIENVDITFI